MRGFEEVENIGTGKTTDGGPARRVRLVRIEGEGFSTSAGTWLVIHAIYFSFLMENILL
jgi:hypothetical protein